MKSFTITQKKTLALIRNVSNVPRATLIFKSKARYSRKQKHKGDSRHD